MFRHARLPNGLDVVAELNPSGYTAAFGFFVGTGSRDERPEELGLSHFLEHMVFKGTARRTAWDVNREFDELGGYSNAYTSEEQTVYYATVLPKYQERVVDLLADILSPALRDDDFETERQVILEEIAKYHDQPPFDAFETAMERYFPDHPLGRRILGTTESISAVSADAMRAYFQRRYTPSSVVLAAAGAVDFDRLVDQLTRLTGSWQPAGAPERRTRPTVAPPSSHRITASEATQSYLIRLAPAPSARDSDRYAMRLLATVLGDDSGSRLYWELVDTGRAEAANLFTQEYEDTGILFSYLACAPDALESNQRLFDDLLRRAAEQGITAAELEQAQNKTCASMVLGSEQPSSRMFSVGNRWIVHGVYEPLDDTLARYRRVTLDQINDLLARYALTPVTEVTTTPA